ncbi:MAG: hypothetical protein AAFO58_12825 [Pseudomonadota bacterium]
MTIEFKVEDRVVKNARTWEVNDFDGWGRGEGVGIIVEPPFSLEGSGEVDVRWPSGRCFEPVVGLLPAGDTKGDDQKERKVRSDT